MIPENVETFFLSLTTRPGEVLQQVTINPAVAEIAIIDNDGESISVPEIDLTLYLVPHEIFSIVVIIGIKPLTNHTESVDESYSGALCSDCCDCHHTA